MPKQTTKIFLNIKFVNEIYVKSVMIMEFEW
jgi:hypothetical protein